jgi:hypothetical protein
MQPPRRLKVLGKEALRRLPVPRLLAYRKQALSLENSPEESDYSSEEIEKLDRRYIWFKSEARWKVTYEEILSALADAQHKR